jgi:hypothetical protein
MTLLQKLSLAAILAPATFAVAASTSRTILPDNVIRCEPSTGCTSQTLNGHNYKVLSTPRFTVMVAITREGAYTRADVSITNNTDAPLNITPDDFRVEVLTPKPKVLNYVSPANLVLPPPRTSTPHPAAESAAETATPPSPTCAAEATYAEVKEASQGDTEKAPSEHHLSATSIAPSEATSGRVYFERDKHAHLINVVLPISGLVFEFPYATKK